MGGYGRPTSAILLAHRLFPSRIYFFPATAHNAEKKKEETFPKKISPHFKTHQRYNLPPSHLLSSHAPNARFGIPTHPSYPTSTVLSPDPHGGPIFSLCLLRGQRPVPAKDHSHVLAASAVVRVSCDGSRFTRPAILRVCQTRFLLSPPSRPFHPN